MKYHYQARTKEGEIQSGTVEASSKEAAINLLGKYGLYVTVLEEEEPSSRIKGIGIFREISRKDIVFFSRQLSIMFKSKIPLLEALITLLKQTKNQQLRDKILELARMVEGGMPFSKALAYYPDIFPHFYVAMVKAGEVSGTLSESLEYLANYLEREYHLMSKIKGAMLYPIMVLLVVFLVLALMTFFIIPKLSEVLQEMVKEVPTITKIVIGIASFFRIWWWMFILGAFIIVVAGLRYYWTDKGKKFFDEFFLKLPFLGSFLRMFYQARFAESFSTLISGGLPISQALEITASVVDNTVYKRVVLLTMEEVKRGRPVSSVLSEFPDVFSPVFTRMVLVGERSGILGSSLRNMADFYNQEIDRAIENFLTVLEPVLIIFLGVIVAVVALSILVPIYQTITF